MSLYSTFVEQPIAGPAATWIALQPDIWLWQPHLRPLNSSGAERESTASTPPWASIIDPTPQGLTIALSQLADLSWVAGTEATQPTLRACEGDWAAAEEFPVALGFGPPTAMSPRGTLGVPTDPASPSSPSPESSGAFATSSSATQAHLKSLPLAQVLPPPTLGHVALLARDGEWQPLFLDLLDEEAAAVQRDLSAALLDLAAPGNWYVATDLLALCALPSGYERKREELRAARLATQGHARDQLQQQLEALEEARSQVETLRSAAQSARRDARGWQGRLGAARVLAQRLARHYSDAQRRAPRPVRKLPPLTAIFGPDTEHVEILSVLPVQAVLAAYSNAQSDGSRWGSADEVPAFVYEKPAGTTALQIRPDNPDVVVDEAVIQSLWAQVRSLSDLDGDVFLIALAQAMAAPADADGNVWITAGQMLDYRGVRPILKRDLPGGPLRRAGHRQEDLERVAECVGRMTNTWVTVRQQITEVVTSGKQRRKKRRLHTHESRLIQVAEVIRQHELSPQANTPTAGRPSLTVAWRYRMGTWLRPFLDAPNRHVSWLVQGVLRYDPVREYWEKRLARYFIFHLRINAAGGGATMTTPVGALLSELSLPIWARHPEQTRQRLEQALDSLCQDGQITSWEYVRGDTPLPPRRWLETWLAEWRVRVAVGPLAELAPRGIVLAQAALPDRAAALQALAQEREEEREREREDMRPGASRSENRGGKKKASKPQAPPVQLRLTGERTDRRSD